MGQKYLDTAGEFYDTLANGNILNLNRGVILIQIGAVVYYYMLQENGDFILQENGDKIIL